ncbi:MAG: hypothetical protein IT160_20795 [Bryobacterales bacterium]|nr:hypothetical protein [Bryobacterales bacterium]
MDLKAFYQKIANAKNAIATPYVIVVSSETPDGGRAGLFTEVTREAAARMIVEGRARLASEEEAARFYAEQADAARRAQEHAASQRVQFALLSESDLQGLRLQTKKLKS